MCSGQLGICQSLLDLRLAAISLAHYGAVAIHRRLPQQAKFRPPCFTMKLLLPFILSILPGTASETPSWEELDARPLPEWYDESKFGIFVHWGLFSVPSFGSEWFWSYWKSFKFDSHTDYINSSERPGFDYTEYATRFRAEFYNASYWTGVFAASGAQYVVLTSKHHEGFCMWNSTSIATTWNWNAVDVGPKRDLLGELAQAVKRTTSPHTNRRLKFGVYHSLYEWFNPLYVQDKANNYATQHFVNLKTGKELYDLVEKYAPELIWSDGEWDTYSDYWKAREFLHWYSTNSSVATTAVWNDRWGNDTLCKHGGFMTCTDRFQPDGYKAQKWEDALTVDTTSWGYNRVAQYSDYMTVKQLIDNLIMTVAKNGNMLLNVGPASDGTIHPIFVDRLLGIGEWLKVNGEGIYGTKPWDVCQNETASSVYYTRKRDRLYAHVTKWPEGNLLRLNCPIATTETHITMLGYTGSPLSLTGTWTPAAGIQVVMPALTPDTIPCQHAWVLVLTGLDNVEGSNNGAGATQ